MRIELQQSPSRFHQPGVSSKHHFLGSDGDGVGGGGDGRRVVPVFGGRGRAERAGD